MCFRNTSPPDYLDPTKKEELQSFPFLGQWEKIFDQIHSGELSVDHLGPQLLSDEDLRIYHDLCKGRMDAALNYYRVREINFQKKQCELSFFFLDSPFRDSSLHLRTSDSSTSSQSQRGMQAMARTRQREQISLEDTGDLKREKSGGGSGRNGSVRREERINFGGGLVSNANGADSHEIGSL